jgi:hypothetical protein
MPCSHRGKVEGIVLLILYLGAVWGGWVVNATSRPLYPGKDPRSPLYRKLGALQGQSGRVWRRENVYLPPEFEPRTVQAGASRYTEYAIPAPDLKFC